MWNINNNGSREKLPKKFPTARLKKGVAKTQIPDIKKTVQYSVTLPNGKTITANSEKELSELYKKESVALPQTIEVEFPVVFFADDYHEFQDKAAVLSILTKQEISYKELPYEEVLCGSASEGGDYAAVFWIGKAEPKELVKKVIQPWLTTEGQRLCDDDGINGNCEYDSNNSGVRRNRGSRKSS